MFWLEESSLIPRDIWGRRNFGWLDYIAPALDGRNRHREKRKKKSLTVQKRRKANRAARKARRV